uniref:Uncharacterized protein n=1 Tax=Picea sitchensis TaxID=3332 RepID=D5A9A9_PICSI|nr:unknown [Picea sitchensis]
MPICTIFPNWRFKLILTGIKYLCTKTLGGFWDVLFIHTVCAATWAKRLMGSDSLGLSGRKRISPNLFSSMQRILITMSVGSNLQFPLL